MDDQGDTKVYHWTSSEKERYIEELFYEDNPIGVEVVIAQQVQPITKEVIKTIIQSTKNNVASDPDEILLYIKARDWKEH